jgi:AraC family transcriptional regulator of adaptative response / DNA-3-methyladenine glycosylase II
LALARAARAQTARILLETTNVPIAEVALAAGFGSVRQFNDTIREVFARSPSELRTRAPVSQCFSVLNTDSLDESNTGTLDLRLPFREPFDADWVMSFLAARAVPGVEEVLGGVYRRSLRLPGGAGVVELEPADRFVRARLWLEQLRDLPAAVQRCRTLLDLDSDPVAVDDVLGGDELLGPGIRRRPGLRVPGSVDGDELAIRAVLGQQVSVAGAATLAGRLVQSCGEQLAQPLGGVTHLFPSAAELAELDPQSLAMPRSRGAALRGLARALVDGDVVLDAGADRESARDRLLALPGIGPWTADYIAMRALRDPDAFLPTDLGVRHGIEALGLDGSPAGASRVAEAWRPYRAYAVMHLWALATGTARRPARLAA